MNVLTRLALALQPLETFAARRPRLLMGGLLSLVAAFGVTAFGIAPLVPEEAPRTTQLVTPLADPQLEAQLEQLAEHRLGLLRHEHTRPGDSADSLLARLGAFDPGFVAFLRSDPTARLLLQGRAGKRVALEADPAGRVLRLVARFPVAAAERERSHFSRLVLEPADGRWSARLEEARYGSELRLASGTIESSLFAATDEAGLPDSIATQLADMFSAEVDFHRELRKGDRFSLVFESLTADGEPVTWGDGAGRILAAEFVNAGRTHQAMWFQETGSKGGYYGFDGQSRRRAFLASPMEFSRVSSGFAMRFHPLLQTWRKHNGVDYSAPTGTPVRSVGDGVVDFAGRQNGYGNVVIVRHAGGKETLYAHLSRIDVRKGQRIDQGTRLGAVGATGWATGPHLHFEFRVGGVHKDPRQLARASEAVKLSPAALKPFLAQVDETKLKLQVAASLGEGVSGAH
jgi:murein DD-endopeptidase MepM/ murein hydrolase activator NlpD